MKMHLCDRGADLVDVIVVDTKREDEDPCTGANQVLDHLFDRIVGGLAVHPIGRVVMKAFCECLQQ